MLNIVYFIAYDCGYYGHPTFNNVNKFKKFLWGQEKNRKLSHKKLGTFPILYVTHRHFVVYRFWSDSTCLWL